MDKTTLSSINPTDRHDNQEKSGQYKQFHNRPYDKTEPEASMYLSPG